MKTTRRTFLSAIAAFVFGVQAEVYPRPVAIRPPKPKKIPELTIQWSDTLIAVCAEDIPFGAPVYFGEDGRVYSSK